MLHAGRRTATELESLLRAAAAGAVTYPHTGSSLRSDPRPGGQPRRSVAHIGSGRAPFQAACDGLRHWAPHAAFGARVHPPDAPIEAGTTVLVVLPFGPFEVVAPNRIVEVVDVPQAFGFAYGTLAGHPECGEESFVVRIDDEGSVTAAVTIDATAGTWLTRMAGPLGRAVQDLAVRRYLAGIASAARAGSG